MSAAAPESPLSRAAQRWWRTTNNLVATAVILVAALAIGREVVHGWWQVRAPQPRETADLLAATPQLPIAGPFEGEPFAGTTDEATATLALRCRAACEARRPLQPVGTIEAAGFAAGQRLGEYDGFEIFLAEGQPPMMAAVAKSTSEQPRAVYCWGLAMPADEHDSPSQWNLYISAPVKTPAQE